MEEFVQVVTTVGSEEEAERLARGIAGTRLAACVQIAGPIRSFYWRQGTFQDAREWQLFIKPISSEEQLEPGDYRHPSAMEQREIHALDWRGDGTRRLVTSHTTVEDRIASHPIVHGRGLASDT